MDAQTMEVLMPEKIKILVIQTAFIGDVILTLPMLQKLKENNPDSKLDVIAIPGTAEIFHSSPAVDEVIILDKKGEQKSFLSLFRFAKMIKNRNYSAIYSPHRSFRTAFTVMQSGVKETFGFTNNSMFHVYRNVVEYNHSDHEVKRNLSLIGFNTDLENWKIFPEIRCDKSQAEKVKDLLVTNHLRDGFIAIAPGSVWKTKRYPIENYRSIVRSLAESGFKIVLMGAESDQKLCDVLLEDSKSSTISFAGKLSIVESVELLKNAKLLVTNDSAPTHFGMAADIPVLTLYCSTVPGFGFYPYNSKSKYLSFDDLKCKPCGIHGFDECPLKHFDCGNKLNPVKVLEAVFELIDKKD